MSWKQALIYASVAVVVFVACFKAYSAWNARVTPEKIAAGKLLFEHEGTIDDQWQTPPLWGVADSAPYFHDGRSPTLKMAIERHRGQAEFSSQQFKKITAHDQHCLSRFLKTLRAPQ